MSQVHLEFPWASSPSALLSPMLHPGLGKNHTIMRASPNKSSGGDHGGLLRVLPWRWG